MGTIYLALLFHRISVPFDRANKMRATITYDSCLSAASSMARYSDYCMESICTLQNKSGTKFKNWIQLEDALISEIHKFTRDTMNSILTVPLA
jgi:hypothetical protein